MIPARECATNITTAFWVFFRAEVLQWMVLVSPQWFFVSSNVFSMTYATLYTYTGAYHTIWQQRKPQAGFSPFLTCTKWCNRRVLANVLFLLLNGHPLPLHLTRVLQWRVQKSCEALLFALMGLWLWDRLCQHLVEIMTLEGHLSIVCNETVQAIEGKVIYQIVFGLAPLLLRLDTTVVDRILPPGISRRKAWKQYTTIWNTYSGGTGWVNLWLVSSA